MATKLKLNKQHPNMIAFDCVRVCVWMDLWKCVAFIVSYALHLLILGTCYAVHINASSL